MTIAVRGRINESSAAGMKVVGSASEMAAGR
jgi:hypothetical protein